MHSEQYKNLMDLLYNQRRKIQRIDIQLGNSEHAELTFVDGGTLNITDDEAIRYVLTLKRGIDNDGDFVFRHIKDLNKYFDDEKFLCHDHKNKIIAALKELASGRFKFAYDVDALQKEFLLSTTRNAVKFEPLRKHYFYIAAHRLNENAITLKLHAKYKRESAGYDPSFQSISKIVAKAFRNDNNFIKNFANKDKRAKLDVLETIHKYASTLHYATDMAPLFQPSGIATEAGINLVLNAYRKNAEACVDLLNFVRIAHEFNTGVDQPDNQKKAQDNKQLLVPELGGLLDCFEPHLRNSESHLNTQLDHQKHKLKISDQGGYSTEYTYTKVVDMTNNLTHNLLPALVVGVIMESQVVILILSNRSAEYITALLGIDNT